MLRALPDNEWYQNGSESVLCQLPFTAEQVEAAFGVAFARPQDRVREPARLVVQIEGCVFLLNARQDAKPPQSLVVVSVRGDLQDPKRCLPVVCAAFGVREDELPWLSDALQPKPWALYRLDDNGNKVAMWYFRERQVAEGVAQHYEQLGHKQLYTVEQAI